MSDTIEKDEVEFDADVFDSMLHGNFDEEVADDASDVDEGVEDDADAEAKKEEAKKAEEAKSKLDEVDEKLKSIINDPDISL